MILRQLLSIVLLIAVTTQQAFASCRPADSRVFDMRTLASNANETFRGPRNVMVNYINPLRYDYSWATVTTFGSAPDLWSKLTAPSGSASTPASPTTPPSQSDAEKHAAELRLQASTQRLQAVQAARGVPRAVTGQVTAETLTLNIDILQLDLSARGDLLPRIDAESNKLTQLETGGSGGTGDVTDLRGSILQQQSAAARATSNVKASGDRLSALLESSDAIIRGQGNLVSSVNSLRDAAWQSSLSQAWPGQDQLDTLRAQLQVVVDNISREKSALPGFVANTTRDLTDLQNKVDSTRAKLYSRQQIVESNASLKATDEETITLAVKMADKLHDDLRDRNVMLLAFSSRLDQLSTIETQLATILDDIGNSGQRYQSFVAAKESLSEWNVRLDAVLNPDSALTPAGYTTSQSVDCEYSFARTKRVKVTLSRVDRMPGSNSTSASSFELGTMECASPFDVSAGVAFSFVTQREYGIGAVPNSNGSTTNRFVLTSDSSFHPVPIALISARLCEISERVGFGAAFGVAAKIAGTSSGGSAAEYLIGPTVSLYRAIFVTPGVYLSNVAVLGNGYSLGAPVPASVTTPPLQTSYKPGFGLAITFTKP